MINDRYSYLNKFSKSVGIPPENLVKAFEIEKIFHEKILEEKSFDKRQKLYEDVYNTVHPIYGKKKSNFFPKRNPKDNVVRLFIKELKDKSILDVGCGEGYFLKSIAENLPHKRLVGIDVSLPPDLQDHTDIEFNLGNVINFDLNSRFDVIFSDQVLEHIAPADLSMHLESVRASMEQGGIFIINMPNRLFGPSDVTRIIDFTHTGKIKAQGTHLNESTYSELIPILKHNGFTNFKTVCFIPKVKNLFVSSRFSPSLLLAIESSSFMLKLLHSIKLNGQCIAKFGITLICSKC